ncbi:carboxypeptidase-like regulatory domain-containing protein [Paragemmobacter ruber]|uniref:Cobalt ABC transporter permease n=1 Tax=Paragemmobacter ruber TaxID=1985673 RepID=A0ABW9Y5U7_9RHOB|nr:carboxypeptidase-like regulatory domain-containing protein [Rhodobacter ruber]NBE07898.1 cobalt ABC transporter permease [Rhodobacter ruber]
MIRARALALALLLMPALALPAAAHKVIAAVYLGANTIEGEIGFSDGDMAAGVPVTVTDPAGRVLGETVTDAEGLFSFTPIDPVTHVFRADLGAGHVAQVTLPAEEVARLLGKAAVTVPAAAAPQGDAAAPAADTAAIAALLRDELRPLRQDIAAYKEKNDLQTILGGIGYIFGLFGIGFYIAARRRMAKG